MIRFLKKLFTRPDIRTSSMERDSFIRTVEKYLEDKPDIVYNESVKEKLIDWFTNHDDDKIMKYLGL